MQWMSAWPLRSWGKANYNVEKPQRSTRLMGQTIKETSFFPLPPGFTRGNEDVFWEVAAELDPMCLWRGHSVLFQLLARFFGPYPAHDEMQRGSCRTCSYHDSCRPCSPCRDWRSPWPRFWARRSDKPLRSLQRWFFFPCHFDWNPTRANRRPLPLRSRSWPSRAGSIPSRNRPGLGDPTEWWPLESSGEDAPRPAKANCNRADASCSWCNSLHRRSCCHHRLESWRPQNSTAKEPATKNNWHNFGFFAPWAIAWDCHFALPQIDIIAPDGLVSPQAQQYCLHQRKVQPDFKAQAVNFKAANWNEYLSMLLYHAFNRISPLKNWLKVLSKTWLKGTVAPSSHWSMSRLLSQMLFGRSGSSRKSSGR